MSWLRRRVLALSATLDRRTTRICSLRSGSFSSVSESLESLSLSCSDLGFKTKVFARISVGRSRFVSVRLTRERTSSAPHLRWKVRYRTLVRFFSQMIKLYRALSLLYRRQLLQENIRWKALDEIYKICTLLHRSELNISENVRQSFSHFLVKIC